MKLPKTTIEKLKKAADILESMQMAKENKPAIDIDKHKRYERYLRIKKQYEILHKEFGGKE